MLGAARATLGQLLADAGRTAEAEQELMQALAVFERSKMTVQTERLRASLSKFSGV
jgi:Flp pilus assembly protein TadD